MAFEPLTAILGIGSKIIERVFPDPEQRAKAQLELLKLQQEGELKELAAQWDILKIEAMSGDKYTSRWRPSLGWVCVAAFATQFFIGPVGTWIAMLYGKSIVFPTLDMNTFMPVLLGMLGLAGYRTYEKTRNGHDRG